MNRLFLLGALCAVVHSGCSSSPGETHKDSEVVVTGTEGNPCYGNQTCNGGLMCASKICVRIDETTHDAGNETETVSLGDGNLVDVALPDHGTQDLEIVDAIVGQDAPQPDGPIDASPIVDVIVPHDAEVTSSDVWQPLDSPMDLPVDMPLVDAPKDTSTDSGVIDMLVDLPLDTSTIDTKSDSSTDLPISDTATDMALDTILDAPTPDGTQDTSLDMPAVDTANDTTTDTLKDTSVSDTTTDIPLDTAVDTSPDLKPIECPPGHTRSGTLCVDIDECAQGSHTCTGTSVCKNEIGTYTCACPLGEHYCNGTCLPTQTDPNNCGGCGKICLQPASCIDGACVDANCDQAILVPTHYQTLQNAVNAASNGATICVLPGTYAFTNVTKKNISLRAFPGGTKPKLTGIASTHSFTLVGFQIQATNQIDHLVKIPGGELAYNTISGSNCVVSQMLVLSSSNEQGGSIYVHHNDLQGCVGDGVRFEIWSYKGSKQRTVIVENNVVSGMKPISFYDGKDAYNVQSRQYGTVAFNTIGSSALSTVGVSVSNRFLIFDNNIIINATAAIAFTELCQVPPCVTNVNHNVFWNAIVTGDVAYGTGNLFADPKLVWSTKGGCPTVASDSPAIDAAGTIYPVDDFFGAARPVDGDANGVNTADIGCYEYTP